jgi:hypothetical protein
MLKLKGNAWNIVSLAPAIMTAHFSIEYRSHFTHLHATSVGFIGATEQLLIIQVFFLIAYLAPDSNDVYQ